MIKFYFVILILFLLLFSAAVNSQTYYSSKFTKPVCAIDLTFGYAAPSFDLVGSTLKDFYSFKNYAINTGFNASANTKITVVNFPDGQLRTYLTISFSQFTGDDSRAYNIGGFIKNGWPKYGIKDTTIAYVPPTDTAGTSYIRLSAPYAAVGWEVAFFTDTKRKSIINFGVDFDISVVWGRFYDQPSGKNEIHNNILDNTKLGLGFNLGYSYRITNAFGLSLGTRLQITNLFKKHSELTKADGDTFLNDEGNTSLSSWLNKDRTIGFAGVYGGVSFYIAGKK